MRSIRRSLLAGAILIGYGSISISSPWEGGDDFESATVSASKWQPYNSSRANYQYVYAGQLRCVFNNSGDDRFWAWGKTTSKVPSAANWTISAEVHLPTVAPAGVTVDRAKAGIGVVGLPFSPSKARRLYLKVYQHFSDYSYEYISVGNDYSPGNDNGLDDNYINSPDCRISIQHDALLQRDTYRVEELLTGRVLLSNVYDSELSVTPYVAVGAVVSGKKNWPKNNTTLGLDNWSVAENNPDPINLTVANGITPMGVAYAVTVTNLDLVNQRLTGTVALTVGTTSATLPITGLIDKNGYFALTAKGTGANKGFGCVLLYDVTTGTYRPNKNTVTAPNQKVIKF
ncbi:MAG: hypothetical protein EBS53_12280 [Bacteroidetes bacterium]|nr:hypothetical protein [Bacteroidota bacterium]